MSNLLQLESVNKEFEQFKLQNITFTLPAGTIMGLIGENGAGKTTIMKLILGLQQKDSGQIKILGYALEELPLSEKAKIGLVLDEFPYSETFNCREVGMIMSKIYQNWDNKVFENFCTRFDLSDKKVLKTYSKGMKMKLQLAVALSHQAKLLILDEATSGLDPVAREEILDLLLEFIQDEQCSVLMSSHIISDLEKVCDYITYIHQGKIVFSEEKDLLCEEYGIVRGNKNMTAELPVEAVVGVRQHQFGEEALVWRAKLPQGFSVEPASIEDVMIYYNRRKEG